ncbi:Crp/Fnr family transcriptional regulator [Egicoccus sp. AB-alg2]|uniref:Crp/Fnr family transcriptional regulator n=1 Tax=Egicoccus sp. AB-alg2 TaxID=3242693 RepID=UPI00359E79EF
MHAGVASGRWRQPDVVAAARASALLGSLSRDDLALVLGVAQAADHARGSLVLRESDDDVVVVLRGAAKEHRSNLDGVDVVTALLGPGDTAGLPAALGHPGAARVTTLEPATLLVLPGRELRPLVEAHPAVAAACLHAVGAQLGELRDRQVSFAGTSTRERLVHRLLELATRWGQQVDDVVMVRLHLTQEELASWAGVSRESAAKVLADLRRTGIVHTGRRELIVRDLAALETRLTPRRHSSPSATALLLGHLDTTAEETPTSA